MANVKMIYFLKVNSQVYFGPVFLLAWLLMALIQEFVQVLWLLRPMYLVLVR